MITKQNPFFKTSRISLINYKRTPKGCPLSPHKMVILTGIRILEFSISKCKTDEV